MGFEQVLQKTWRDNILFSVLVELTYRCNLDCFFCYNDLSLRGEPLRTEQYFDFFAELRDLQVLHLTLSGGEPLAHPDFLRLGARARDLGFVVRVKSNGHALRGEAARRLRDEVDPFLVEVSLHGATAATHDRQTRVAGSFDRLLANLREALDLGLRIKVNSTMTAWNEGEVEGMLALADSLGVPLQFDPEVTPRDDGDREPLSVSPSRDGVERLFAMQAARARSLAAGEPAGGGALAVAKGGDDGTLPATVEKHCGAGSAGIAVDPYGNVYPCVQWRRPVGNLHRQSIREIWSGSAGLREVRELTTRAKQVIDAYGPAGGLMSFCPGSAVTRTGDPLQIYPDALRRMEVLSEVLAEEGMKKGTKEGKRRLLPILP
jgi:mycofactocin biosynthetic radical S-adenosylmethionine protein MftC